MKTDTFMYFDAMYSIGISNSLNQIRSHKISFGQFWPVLCCEPRSYYHSRLVILEWLGIDCCRREQHCQLVFFPQFIFQQYLVPSTYFFNGKYLNTLLFYDALENENQNKN